MSISSIHAHPFNESCSPQQIQHLYLTSWRQLQKIERQVKHIEILENINQKTIIDSSSIPLDPTQIQELKNQDRDRANSAKNFIDQVKLASPTSITLESTNKWFKYLIHLVESNHKRLINLEKTIHFHRKTNETREQKKKRKIIIKKNSTKQDEVVKMIKAEKELLNPLEKIELINKMNKFNQAREKSIENIYKLIPENFALQFNRLAHQESKANEKLHKTDIPENEQGENAEADMGTFIVFLIGVTTEQAADPNVDSAGKNIPDTAEETSHENASVRPHAIENSYENCRKGLDQTAKNLTKEVEQKYNTNDLLNLIKEWLAQKRGIETHSLEKEVIKKEDFDDLFNEMEEWLKQQNHELQNLEKEANEKENCKNLFDEMEEWLKQKENEQPTPEGEVSEDKDFNGLLNAMGGWLEQQNFGEEVSEEKEFEGLFHATKGWLKQKEHEPQSPGEEIVATRDCDHLFKQIKNWFIQKGDSTEDSSQDFEEAITAEPNDPEQFIQRINNLFSRWPKIIQINQTPEISPEHVLEEGAESFPQILEQNPELQNFFGKVVNLFA